MKARWVAAASAAVAAGVAGSRQVWDFENTGRRSAVLLEARHNRSQNFDDAVEAANAAEAAAKAAASSEAVSVTNEHTAKWRVFTDLARDLAAQKKYDQAQRYLRRARQEAIKGFGENDAHVAAAIQNEAEFLRVQRRYEDAEPLYMEAMDRLEAVLGRSSAPWAAAAHNAAALYTAKQDYERAKELYEAALKVKIDIFGMESMDTAVTIFKLAELMYAEGKRDDALSMLKQALNSLEEAGLVNNSEYAKMLSKLANMLQHQGRMREAQIALERLLICLESGEGVWNHFSARIRVLFSLASLHRLKGGRDAAVSYARSADALLEKYKEEKADVTESPIWLQNKLRVLFLLLESDEGANVESIRAQLDYVGLLVKVVSLVPISIANVKSIIRDSQQAANPKIKDERIQSSLQEELTRLTQRVDQHTSRSSS